MPSRNLFRVLLSIILLFSAAIVTNQFAVAQTPPADQSTLQELDLLNTAIADIEAWLSQANADRPQVETQLESIEQQISTIIQQSNTTNSSINQIEKEIEDLNLLTDELTLAKQQQTEQVNQVVRAAYIDGQQSNLKLLLNQQDPVLAMRMLHYYQLYNSVKIQQIENFQNTLEELAITQEKFQQQTAELALQQEQLLSQQAQLDLTRVKRQEALDQTYSCYNCCIGEDQNQRLHGEGNLWDMEGRETTLNGCDVSHRFGVNSKKEDDAEYR